ncbi:MAG: metallophosphoesterase [Clostridia bacterium]|nr:metallophosphoesterase [Clostridia bacterium]
MENILRTKKELRFKDGKFKILCVSDFHGVKNFDRRLIRDFSALLDSASPDLVLILGDTVCKDAAESEDSVRAFLSQAVKPLEDRKIPWAHVFGGHDDERGVTNEMQEKIYESFPYCVSKTGDADVSGTGNYVLPVMSEDGSRIVYNVWGLDSHDGAHDYAAEFGLNPDMWWFFLPDSFSLDSHYDTFRFDQLMWYWNTSKAIEKHEGHKIPGLMVAHMPMPEYILCYKNTAQTNYNGTRREHIGCNMINSGLFSTLVQRGDVKTFICGHDHINDFEASYCGVKLAYDAGLNYDGYCDDDLRGGRIVEIDENDPWNVKTYMLYCKDIVKNYPGEEDRNEK